MAPSTLVSVVQEARWSDLRHIAAVFLSAVDFPVSSHFIGRIAGCPPGCLRPSSESLDLATLVGSRRAVFAATAWSETEGDARLGMAVGWKAPHRPRIWGIFEPPVQPGELRSADLPGRFQSHIGTDIPRPATQAPRSRRRLAPASYPACDRPARGSRGDHLLVKQNTSKTSHEFLSE